MRDQSKQLIHWRGGITELYLGSIKNVFNTMYDSVTKSVGIYGTPIINVHYMHGYYTHNVSSGTVTYSKRHYGKSNINV